MDSLDLDNQDARVLGKILRRRTEKIPDETYLIAGEQRYSYGRVNELANAYAAGLRGLGVEPGDTVALFMGSVPEFLVATFAINKLGAIWIPINTDYRGHWLRAGFEDSTARVLVADAELLPRVAQLGPGLPFERIVVRGRVEEEISGVPMVDLAEFAGLGTGEPDIEISYRDTAAVLWTSGTTGRPKGVMQSHSSWIWSSRPPGSASSIQR
jgi:crotonobetaine/carnitine-CoA ligase